MTNKLGQSSIRAHFRARAPFTEQELDRIGERLVFKKIKKRQNLLVEGNIPQYLIFVNQGLLRMYLPGNIQTKTKAFTLEIAPQNTWLADLKSFYSRSSSQVVIEALEDSDVWLLHHDDVEILHHQIPNLVLYSRKHGEEKYTDLLERMWHVNNFSYPAIERLIHFEKLYSDILHRIPAYVIASFLGISEETLSRLKRPRNSSQKNS